MIEIYAITDAPPTPAMHATGLRPIEHQGLFALCSRASSSSISAAALWEREELLERLMAQVDLLPVRYGTVVPDEQSAARILRDQRSELLGALRRVQGCIEVSLRVFVDADADAAAATGAEYLHQRAARGRMRAAANSVAHEPLAALARAARVRAIEMPPELMRASYLVPRADLDRFVDRVALIQEMNTELRLLCTGPWPPYSFVAP